MNIVLSVTFAGTPDAADTAAARLIVAIENARITAENVRLAALVPPGTPLPLLPVATPAQLKSSYLSLLTAAATQTHVYNIDQASKSPGLKQVFTDAEIQQIVNNLVARAAGGEATATIIADTVS